jgi:hypothetical protein
VKRAALLAVWIGTLALAGAYSAAAVLPPVAGAIIGGLAGAILGWWRRPD